MPFNEKGLISMFRELREAWRIVRIAKDDGYKGPFVVLRETMMEEIQAVYGRVLAENKHYRETIDAILNGKPVCEFCEDCKECENHDKWLEGRCTDFMLKFPDNEEAAKTFDECYKQCEVRCYERD